jgi:hypothetical protein
MLDEHVMLRPAHVRKARRIVRTRLVDLGYLENEVVAVEAVVAELLGAVVEAGESTSVRLTITSFPLLTSVRLRCPGRVQTDIDPLALRERVLERFTVATGRRENDDATVDLWAEVPRLRR